jgi:phosphoadenosine phosphosulfate reductase
VVFIDTGFLFPETYQYAEELQAFLGLDLRIYHLAVSAARMQALWGNLWAGRRPGKDRYAMLTKIEPMNRALREIGADVWLSGLRRSQSRPARPPIRRAQKKTLKAYPILDWATPRWTSIFISPQPAAPSARRRGLRHHGRLAQHPPGRPGDARATRFNGEKYECGLHLDSGRRISRSDRRHPFQTKHQTK